MTKRVNPAAIYLLKEYKKKMLEQGEVCSMLTIKTLWCLYC